MVMASASPDLEDNWARGRRYWHVLGGTLLAAAILYSFWGTFGNPDCQDADFGSYYRAAVAVGRGESPYTVDEHGPMGVYPYAPAYAYLFLPLGHLDYLWACRIWLALNWIATAAVFAAALRLVLGADWRSANVQGILPLAIVPMLTYIWADLRVGQIAMFMTLGCVGWMSCRQRGRPFAGGLCLASACALKLAPLAIVPYLVMVRSWRGIAGVGVGLIGLFLLPAAWVGWDGTVRLHQEWATHTRATQVAVQTYRPGNQSLLAELARLPPFSNGHHLYSTARLDTLCQWYPYVLGSLGAALYLWMLLSRRGKSKPDGSERELIEFSTLLVFITLGQPRAWRCNFVALILPCILLAERVWRRRAGFRVSLAALVLLLFAGICPTHGIWEDTWTVGGWLLLGKHFWGAVAVGVACCWGLGQADKETRGQGEPDDTDQLLCLSPGPPVSLSKSAGSSRPAA
jgi:hypothetical protein